VIALSDARRFRKLVAGVCLIAAPAVLLLGALTHPQSERDAAGHLAVAAEDPDRYYAAHAILLVGLALFLPALLGLMHLLRGREIAFGHLGAGFAMIGLFGATAIVAIDGAAVTQMAQPEANADEMAALLDRIKESAGFRAIAVVGAIAWAVGMLLLAYGLWRARRVGPLVAVVIAAAAITVFIGEATDNRTILAIAFGLYLVALGPLGWLVLRQSDEEWARESTARTTAPAPV
jgi:hypothetical protein